MKRSGLFIVLGILVIVFFWGCNSYNNLIDKNEGINDMWSKVQTQYQRRTDLYSSVISVIESSAKFERATLTEVIDARSKATSIKIDVNDPASLEAYQKAQESLQGSFSRLMAIAENYPDLKTTKAFQDFQTDIGGTENRINQARRDYISAVKEYNLRVKRFPGNILASIFGFKAKEYYEADKGAEKAPEIKIKID